MYTLAIELDGDRATRGQFGSEGHAWGMLEEAVRRMRSEYHVKPMQDKLAYTIYDAEGKLRGSVGVIALPHRT